MGIAGNTRFRIIVMVVLVIVVVEKDNVGGVSFFGWRMMNERESKWDRVCGM
jgi:hypothetical protein